MENLLVSFRVVLPLFIMMWLGYFLKKLRLYSDATLSEMNNVCFRVFLPILLFMNVYQSDLKTAFNPRLLTFGLGALVVTFLFLCFYIPRIEPENRKRGVLIQAIFRNNFILFGVPITISLYGEGSVGVVAILVAFVVPLLNALSVVALETFRGGKLNIKQMMRSILTNPFIIAAILGVGFLVTGIKFPMTLEKTLLDISKVTTPLSLMILGGSFKFESVRSSAKQIFIGVSGKLIFVPLVFMPIGIWMGFRDVELVALLAMFATPTAVSSFTMAQQMGADGDLAGQIVVFGTITCVFTLFLWVFALKQFGLI